MQKKGIDEDVNPGCISGNWQAEVGAPVNRDESSELPEKESNRLIRYRYKAKLGTVTPKHFKERIFNEYERCVLGVSLGNPKMEEDKLEASIKWVSEHFSFCKLVVGDSIYRHTLQVTKGLPANDSLNAALNCGREFIKKYETIVEKYSDYCRFEWALTSTIENHHNFERLLKEYVSLYENDVTFQGLVREGAEKYLSGLSNTNDLLTSTNRENNINISVNYFIEESALFTCLCEDGWRVLVYPGTIKPLQVLSDGSITGVPSPILGLIQLRLNLSKKNAYFANTPLPNDTKNHPPQKKPLANIRKKDWSVLLQYGIHKNIFAGDIFALQGSTDRLLYVVSKGGFEALSIDNFQTGRTSNRDVFRQGGMIGVSSCFVGTQLKKSIAAFTDCEVIALSNFEIQKLVRKNPETASRLLLDVVQALVENCDE